MLEIVSAYVLTCRYKHADINRFIIAIGSMMYLGIVMMMLCNGKKDFEWYLGYSLLSIIYSFMSFCGLKKIDTKIKLRKMWVTLIVFTILLNLYSIYQFGITSINKWIHLSGCPIMPGEWLKPLIILLSASTYMLRNEKDKRLAYYICVALSIMMLILAMDITNACMIYIIFLISAYFIIDGRVQKYILAAVSIILLFSMEKLLHLIGAEYAATNVKMTFQVTKYHSTQHYMALSNIIKSGFSGFGVTKAMQATNLFDSFSTLVFDTGVAVYGIGFAIVAAISIALLLSIIHRMIKRKGFKCVLMSISLLSIVAQMLLHVGGNLNVVPLSGTMFMFVSVIKSCIFSSWITVSFVMLGLLQRFD